MSVGRVLVIEDDPGVAEVLRRGLALKGLEVTVAEDGTAGRAAWSSGEFDLVLLDIMLPETEGLSLFHELRAVGDQTPVLILSARDDRELRQRAAFAGAAGYIVKPFAYADLICRVAQIIPGVSTPRE